MIGSTCAAASARLGSGAGPPALVRRLVGSFTLIREALLCPEMGVDREGGEDKRFPGRFALAG